MGDDVEHKHLSAQFRCRFGLQDLERTVHVSKDVCAGWQAAQKAGGQRQIEVNGARDACFTTQIAIRRSA